MHACSEVMEEYQKRMRGLAYQLLILLLKALDDISEQEIKQLAASTYESQGALQLNSYPPCPNPTRAIGLPQHTDTMLLTILNQTQTPGLQVHRDGLGWITVAPVTGALVVNIGDLLHIYSNAKYRSAYHRVIVNEKVHRISVAYFYGAQTDSQVEPLSKLQSPLYRSLSVKDYISIKAKYQDKALPMIRINTNN